MSEQHDLLGDVSAEDLQQLLAADADLPEAQRRWAPMLVDLVRVIEATHVRRGMEAEAAFASALDAVKGVAEYFGGRPLYIPRGDRLLSALRDAEMFRRAKGGNFDQLAVEYGLSTLQVYRIVRQQKALHLRRIQGRLFSE